MKKTTKQKKTKNTLPLFLLQYKASHTPRDFHTRSVHTPYDKSGSFVDLQ